MANKTIPTYKEIVANYTLHHTSMTRGYVSRVGDTCIIAPYDGKFGKGYTVKTPRWDTTNYCDISYYITKD